MTAEECEYTKVDKKLLLRALHGIIVYRNIRLRVDVLCSTDIASIVGICLPHFALI